ncbi:MAG: alpha-hydroxy-acid oxidizing protein [Desulfobacula sp.]|jgi:isopentenyl diphosphate isomerase/L-lactate dehydrogenase-like FMN-dependent dehydrogenase
MKDVYENARKLMKGYCRVCKECDGYACAGEVPGMGGLGTALSFKANVTALKEIRFNMRLIHDVTEPDTSVSILGKNLSMPVIAAPIGGVSFNMGGLVSEEEYIRSVIFGCKAKGIIGCTGDGVPDFIHETGLGIIKEAEGHGIPFIKPWADKELFEKLEKVGHCKTGIMGMDIDAAGLITLKKMGRPVTPKTLEKLSQIIKQAPAKFILKGVMTVDDAKLAVDAGADAIVVSNHGGRVLDYTPGAATVLPDISAAVKGKITLLADGGVRTGGDVLKLLALGADAVMIGRPFSVAAMGGLQNGVELYIDKIRTELEQAMVLTGTPSIGAVSGAILHNYK